MLTPEGKDMSDKKLRSRAWFDNPDNPDMTALISNATSISG